MLLEWQSSTVETGFPVTDWFPSFKNRTPKSYVFNKNRHNNLMRFEMGQWCSSFTQFSEISSPKSMFSRSEPIHAKKCFTHDLIRIGIGIASSCRFHLQVSENEFKSECLEKLGLTAVTSEKTRNIFFSLHFCSEPVLIIK